MENKVTGNHVRTRVEFLVGNDKTEYQHVYLDNVDGSKFKLKLNEQPSLNKFTVEELELICIEMKEANTKYLFNKGE